MATTFFSLATLAGCAGLQEWAATEQGQETIDQGLNLLDQLGGIIPIPGMGVADEVLSFILVLFGIRKGYDGLKNSTPGKFFGGKTDEN